MYGLLHATRLVFESQHHLGLDGRSCRQATGWKLAFLPTKALVNVDFPALGTPTTPTVSVR